jgi:hypothetical protein
MAEPVTATAGSCRLQPSPLGAQAVQDDAQAGFYRPACPGVLGQGADHRQQLGRRQVRAEWDLLPGSVEQAGEAASHRAAQGANGRTVVAQRFPDPGAHARVLGRAPVIQLQPLAQPPPHVWGGQHFRIALAVLDLLSEAAASRPLLLIAEDAHWLDQPSVDVLSFVARRLESEPIVLLAAARDGYPEVFRAGELPELALRPLDPASSAHLLEHSNDPLSPAERGRVLHEAAGNPLALVELPSIGGGGGAEAGGGDRCAAMGRRG